MRDEGPDQESDGDEFLFLFHLSGVLSLRRPGSSGMDKTLLLFINREWTSPFMDRLMASFTSFEVWMPILVLIALALLWRGDFRVRSFVVVTLLTIACTDGIFTQFMKKLVNRPRPNQALAEVREVSLEKTKPAILGVWKPVQVSLSRPPEGPVVGRSFPSGHAMNNTIIATMAILFLEGWAPSISFPQASLPTPGFIVAPTGRVMSLFRSSWGSASACSSPVSQTWSTSD